MKVKDKDYFLSQEKINDMYIHYLGDEICPILACEENMVKVISNSEQKYYHSLDSGANVLAPFSKQAKVFNTKQ